MIRGIHMGWERSIRVYIKACFKVMIGVLGSTYMHACMHRLDRQTGFIIHVH